MATFSNVVITQVSKYAPIAKHYLRLPIRSVLE